MTSTWPCTSPSTTTPAPTFLSLTLSLRGCQHSCPNKLTQNLRPSSQRNVISHSQCKSWVLILTMQNVGMQLLPSRSCTSRALPRAPQKGQRGMHGTLAMNEVSLLLTFLNVCQSSLTGPQLTAGGPRHEGEHVNIKRAPSVLTGKPLS